MRAISIDLADIFVAFSVSLNDLLNLYNSYNEVFRRSPVIIF